MATSSSSCIDTSERCDACHAPATPGAVLQQCSGCRAAHYCDPVCQRLHWKSHKEACKGTAQARFAANLAAAERGDEKAQFDVGSAYDHGHGVAKDPKLAFLWYLRSAEAGSHEAQYNLATCYLYGTGVPANAAEAIRWFRLAAEGGLDGAQHALGLCYERGTGVEQCFVTAIRWYLRAAQQGCPGAILKLATLVEEGKGTPAPDPAKAAKLYRELVSREDAVIRARAEYHLGFLLSEGRGVPCDLAEAAKVWRHAAEAGHGPSMNQLAHCLLTSKGVEEDAEEAASWLTRSARSRSSPEAAAEAVFLLSRMHEEGVGVLKCAETAAKMLQLAADAGHPEAIEMLGDASATAAVAPCSDSGSVASRRHDS